MRPLRLRCGDEPLVEQCGDPRQHIFKYLSRQHIHLSPAALGNIEDARLIAADDTGRLDPRNLDCKTDPPRKITAIGDREDYRKLGRVIESGG